MGRDVRIIPENPHNVALIRGGASDATVQVEFWDVHGRTVAINSASSATLTISSTAKSLHYFITGGIPAGAVGGRILVLTNSICVNTGGTDNGSVGDGGNGLMSSAVAPTSSSPRRYVAGDSFEFGGYRPA